MNIDYYREFIVLGKYLNFTKAAEELHITQPALSKHISALEREYGAELLIRDRRTVQLSDPGRILYGSALEFVDTYDRTKAAIASIVKSRPIRVDGILYDNTVSSIISLSTVLLNDQNHVPILFERHEGKSLFELLENDEIDMAFAFDEKEILEARDLAFKPLAEAQFAAIVDGDHPLAKRKELHMEDLKDEVFIQFIDEYSINGWRRIEHVCRKHGFEPRKRPKLGNAATSYVSTPPDGGVLVVQQNLRQLKYLGDVSGSVALPVVDDDAKFIIYYIYKKENEKRLQMLIDALEESREIIMKHRREGE